MGKRLITANARSETILQHLPDGHNISSYVNAAILDEALPGYSQLRTEALWLLDVITDGAKEWSGNKLIINGSSDPRKSLPEHINATLGRGICWLRDGHHIKDPQILLNVIDKYETSGHLFCKDEAEHNRYVQEQMAGIRAILKSIDPDYTDTSYGLGSLAKDVLRHWDILWDQEEGYNTLISCVYCENVKREIDPMFAISALQGMESRYIIEAIGDAKY